MRKFFLLVPLLAALGWLAQPCLAQTLDASIRNIYAPLDKSQAQSGILIHQTPVFVWPGRYDGANVADSMQLSIDKFGMLYGQFRGAAVGQPSLPTPSTYIPTAIKPHRQGDTVALAFMAMRYDFIRAAARDANLIEWREGQMHDVAGRTQSPYGQDTCFAFTALQQKVQGLNIRFSLPDSLIFNNLNWNIAEVLIDFGDGQGLQVVQTDSVVEATYAEGGRKRIFLQYALNGQIFKAVTFIDLQESLFERLGHRSSGGGGNTPYDPDDAEVVVVAGMKLSIFSACEDKKVRRPLIVVEGFGGTTDQSTLFLLLEQAASDGTTLEAWLNAHEYDLIWVDYSAPFASIQTNASSLISVIEWVNARKHADGSSEPNALIGASMGGLVSKLALLQMHNVQGKDSEVNKFFTYDSPLKGANYPIGIQTFLRDLVYIAENVGASTASLQGALQLLDSPAAQDLLLARVEIAPGGGPLGFVVGPSSNFTALQNTFAQLEQIRPISAIARHIVLSNGANAGVLQENMDPMAKFLHFFMQLREVTGAGVWQGCYDVTFNAHAFAATNVSTLIYVREITVDVSIICEPFGEDDIDRVEFVLPAPLNLDNAPGSTSNLGIGALEQGLFDLINDEDIKDDVEFFTIDVSIRKFCFIPTVSSLDMPTGTNPNTSTPNGGGTVSRWTASNDNSQTCSFTDLPEFNQEHVTINTRIVDVIVDELEPVAVGELAANVSSGFVYNFGRGVPINNVTGVRETPRTISQDLLVESGAQLWINRDNRIGFINVSNNPFNGKPQQFVVSVPGAKCEEDVHVTVTTESGGKIVVGEYDGDVRNIGQLRFGKNSELIVNGPEGVKVDKRSTLAIEGGATMSINPGAKVTAAELSSIFVQNGSQLTIQSGGTLELNWGAKCVVRENSRIVVESGGILQISHPKTNVTVQSGGEIVLRPGAILRLWDGQQDDGEAYLKIEGGGKFRIEGNFDLSGNGYIWLQAWPTPGYPVFEDLRPEIRFNGHSKTCRLFFLDYAGFGAVNKPLRLENLEVYLNSGGVSAENGAVRVFDATFRNFGVGSTALTVRGGTFMHVRNTDFVNLDYGMEIADHLALSSAFARIQDSKFTDCFRGISMFNSKYLNITNTEFVRSPIELFNVSNLVSLTNSTITGPGGFGEIYGGLWDLAQGSSSWGIFSQDVPRLRISGGLIHNNETGIFVPAMSRSNIMLTNKATVRDNQIGIHVQNGFRDVSGGSVQNYGMVLMDCSRLLDNNIGIFGSNVLLQIDAFANSGTKDWAYVRSNHFRVQPTGSSVRRLFSICYDALGYNVSSVSATGNYWEGLGSATFNPWRLFNSALAPSSSSGCYVGTNPDNVSLIRDPEATAEPLACPPPPPDPPNPPNPPSGDAFACPPPSTSGMTNNLHKQYFNGYRQFGIDADGDAGDFSASDAIFQPLADIDQSDLAVMSEKCQNFTEGARAFVRGDSDSQGGRPSNGLTNYKKTLPAAQKGLFTLSPNPASSVVLVKLAPSMLSVRVRDAMGRLMAEYGASGDYLYLDVSSWSPGLYIVEGLSEDRNANQQVKLIVE